jgi:hypothetical protein
MTGLMKAVASAKPREKAGAHTMARYGFQVHASILKMLDLHRNGSDYRAVFDHFDDLMVFDNADQPEKVDFYQIKSQDKGEWTLKAMTAKKGKGKPATFLGRLHHHMATFDNMVGRLVFVSNLSFKLKLADGTETGPDHHLVRSHELHADEVAALKKAVANDAPKPPAVDGCDLFAFERTSLGINDQDKFVKGSLLDYFHKRGGADHVPVISLYETLQGSVFTKTGVTQEFTTEAEFYDRKTLCRADIEAMFARATGGRRFTESWTAIQVDLTAAGMTTIQMLALHNACLRYIRARSAGESAAAAFNAACQNAIVAHPAEIAACTTLPEVAARLGDWVPSDYDHRNGALFVEAFEAIT